MNVAVVSVIVLLGAILASGCAGEKIAPAESAAPAPGASDPVAALYAAPADVAFFTVSDIRADLVGPGGVPLDPLYGYGYVAEGSPVPSLEDLALTLTAAEAVAPPFNGDVDLDAFFTAAVPAAADAVVWERAPEMQRAGWDSLSAPPDAK